MKPQPRQEMMITTIRQPPVSLFIHFASADTALWVKREAPAFGEYMPPNQHHAHGILFVSPLYDAEEVRRYLETQGE